jgi:hypothetical protein
MNFESAQAAVYARVATHMTANHPTVKVDYENRHLVDMTTQKDPFVSCEVIWNDGEQVSMENSPRARYRGSVWLAIHVKEGQGAKVSNQLLTSLSRLFKAVSFGGVTAMVPVPVPARPAAGWRAQALRVPIYFDDTGA